MAARWRRNRDAGGCCRQPSTISARHSPSPSPTACRAAATARASIGSRSAAAASGSTRLAAGAQRMAGGRRSRGRRVGRAHPVRRGDRRAGSRGAVRRPHRCPGTRRFDPATGAVTPTRGRRLGAIRLRQRPRPHSPTRPRSKRACSTVCGEHGLRCCRGPKRRRAPPPRRLRRKFDASIPELRRGDAARPARRMAAAASSPASAGSDAIDPGALRQRSTAARL